MTANRLIMTLGTSVLSNINALARKEPRTDLEERLLSALKAEEFSEVGKALFELDPNERLCGAEINSFHLIREKGLVGNLAWVHLCRSHTPEGAHVSEILKAYFERRFAGEGMQIRDEQIDGLQDQRPHEFKTKGLRNLVRKIGEIVRTAGGPSFVAIDATGGYKAQIAVAVMIGQALGLSVFYKHEKFDNEVIEFPAMPIAFDFALIARYGDILESLDGTNTVECPHDEMPDEVQMLLDEVEDGSNSVWALAPVGAIYLESAKQWFKQRVQALDAASTDERAKPSLPQHHYPSGFESFVGQVWTDNEFVKRCHAMPYAGQRSIRRRFYVDTPDESRIIGEFEDSAGFKARFAILTTARDLGQRALAAELLNKRYYPS